MSAPTLAPAPETRDPAGHRPVLDVVVPVYNEETDLPVCVRRLHAHLSAEFPYPFRITVADNASTDATLQQARMLAGELPDVRVVHLEQKGRGRALNTVWSTSDALVVAYMDVDLSTDLAALFPLVAPLISGHSDVAARRPQGDRPDAPDPVPHGPSRTRPRLTRSDAGPRQGRAVRTLTLTPGTRSG